MDWLQMYRTTQHRGLFAPIGNQFLALYETHNSGYVIFVLLSHVFCQTPPTTYLQIFGLSVGGSCLEKLMT